MVVNKQINVKVAKSNADNGMVVRLVMRLVVRVVGDVVMLRMLHH